MRAFHNKYSALRDCIEAEHMTYFWTFHNGKYPETSDDYWKHLAAIRVVTPRKRPAGDSSPLQYHPREISLPTPEFRQWRELVDPRTHQRLAEEIFIPGRIRARGGSRNIIKHGDPHRNGDLSLTSQKWLIYKQHACGCIVWMSNFNILVNCLVKSFLFPQNLKFVNTFVVSRYPYQIRSFLDLVTPYQINKRIQKLFTEVQIQRDFIKAQSHTWTFESADDKD